MAFYFSLISLLSSRNPVLAPYSHNIRCLETVRPLTMFQFQKHFPDMLTIPVASWGVMKQEEDGSQQHSALVKRRDLEAKPPGLKSWLCHLLAVTLDNSLNLPLPPTLASVK